jgi:hypothetical protein
MPEAELAPEVGNGENRKDSDSQTKEKKSSDRLNQDNETEKNDGAGESSGSQPESNPS